MGFLDNLGQKMKSEGVKLLKPYPDQYMEKKDLLERFETVDEKALSESSEALFSVIRERCIRGNARRFQIFLDGQEVFKISMDAQCSISCGPGFHKIYVRLDSLTSQVLNVKAEAGKRYFFDIACTMNDGMILRRIEDRQKREEE